MNAPIKDDGSILNHENAIGEGDSLSHVVRDHDCGKSLVDPDALDQPLH
jgi:hypothetical protein